ncbi:uncharacterized protein LOC127097691 [Lathyrus oleraceus]|uniref:uncharacterized protein LOC127097691 n=1 Tax=Pisum sativum TaxID=3888 RepID=UPI0021D3EA1A|nr:uncharacterized protein LOC127097691 [Pisum sativum]
MTADCKENVVTYYNRGQPGHISTHFSKLKQASTGGKVSVLTGTQTSSYDRLIRGICYINNMPLIATGATHSFIVVDRVKRLGLIVSSMNEEMVIETPAKGSVTTTSSEFNHVHINSYNKLVRFLTPGEEEEVGFLSARELKELLEEEAQVFTLFATLYAKIQAMIDELHVVQDFPMVFPDDISDVPPERERWSFLLIFSLIFLGSETALTVSSIPHNGHDGYRGAVVMVQSSIRDRLKWLNAERTGGQQTNEMPEISDNRWKLVIIVIGGN